MEEDCNALIADCIVISCCCQCLILQILIFIFLHFPRRIARKTKEYAKKKLISRQKRKEAKMNETTLEILGDQCNEDHNNGRPMRLFEIKGIDDESELNNNNSNNNTLGHEDCMDEVEKALEELSMRGEFAFGSFWGGDSIIETRSCSHCVITREGLQYGSHVVKFHLIQVVGPLTSS